MVWFQCEDYGDNLKKPKLAGHFRQCSAFKLSCIDCGQVFGQQNVESHTQCITEAEKYGPKDQGKASNGTNTKTKNDAKPKPEVDINVGLTECPPWFCRYLDSHHTKATSKQTLLLHADGKKHRAKARAFHASKQRPNDTAETKNSTEKNAKDEVPENKDSGDQYSTKVPPLCDGFEVENNASKPNKKRTLEASENGGAQHETRGDISTELDSGQFTQIKGVEIEKGLKKAKRGAKQENEESDFTDGKDLAKKKIQWKKLITSALKSNEDCKMKFKKLKKFVAKSLKDSGYTEDKNQVTGMLELKINSSSRFNFDGKYVRLATRS